MMQGMVTRKMFAIRRQVVPAVGNPIEHGPTVARIILFDVLFSQIQQRRGTISLVREYESRGSP